MLKVFKIKECWKFSGVPPAGVVRGKFNVKSGESKSIGGGRGAMTLKVNTKVGCFIILYSMYALHGIVGYPAIPRINKVKYSAIPYNTLWYPTIPCDITNYIFQLHIFHFLISIWLWGCQEWRWERWRRGGHGQTLALQWWWWWWWWWWVGKTKTWYFTQAYIWKIYNDGGDPIWMEENEHL